MNKDERTIVQRLVEINRGPECNDLIINELEDSTSRYQATRLRRDQAEEALTRQAENVARLRALLGGEIGGESVGNDATPLAASSRSGAGRPRGAGARRSRRARRHSS